MYNPRAGDSTKIKAELIKLKEQETQEKIKLNTLFHNKEITKKQVIETTFAIHKNFSIKIEELTQTLIKCGTTQDVAA